MTKQVTRNFPACRKGCIHHHRAQRSTSPELLGIERWPRDAEMAALLPMEPGLFSPPRAVAAPGWGAANLRDAVPVRSLAFRVVPLPPLQKAVGRREGTPGLQISIKGLVRGLWGHLLVLFSLFTPALILGVLIKSVINVKIFYRPIKVPKQK